MKSRLLILLLAAPASAAFAQYKCTAANGAITFQQTPCPGGQAEDKLTVVPNGHPPPASGVKAPPVIVQTAASASVGKVETNIDKRMLANYERQHRRDALEQAVKSAQADKDSRAVKRLQDIAGAKKQFGDDPANAPALRDALQSIDNRYKALTELDESRIQAAQKALDDWDKAQRPPEPAKP
ncbi:MAG TPA: DUF4124 domain-containing protein [Burkholderiaceae bacterium]